MIKTYETYDELPRGAAEFRKKVTIKAVQIMSEFSVITLEGKVKGKPGDWLAQGVQGELYIIADNIFQQTYETI